MQKIGETGDGKSAVATPDGNSRKKKKRSANMNILTIISFGNVNDTCLSQLLYILHRIFLLFLFV